MAKIKDGKTMVILKYGNFTKLEQYCQIKITLIAIQIDLIEQKFLSELS